ISKLKTLNNPTSDQDCWFFNSDGNTKYGVFKVGNKAEIQVNWRLHRVMYVLLHPEDYTLIVEDSSSVDDNLIRHKCNNGRKHSIRNGVCANPYCLIKGTQTQNRDDNGCL